MKTALIFFGSFLYKDKKVQKDDYESKFQTNRN